MNLDHLIAASLLRTEMQPVERIYLPDPDIKLPLQLGVKLPILRTWAATGSEKVGQAQKWPRRCSDAARLERVELLQS